MRKCGEFRPTYIIFREYTCIIYYIKKKQRKGIESKRKHRMGIFVLPYLVEIERVTSTIAF